MTVILFPTTALSWPAATNLPSQALNIKIKQVKRIQKISNTFANFLFSFEVNVVGWTGVIRLRLQSLDGTTGMACP